LVDREKRRAAADLLQGLFEGKITNDDYDNDFPESPGDLGLTVVYDRIWLYYSDLHTHFLDRSDLSTDDMALFSRSILFLQTDIEYCGPVLRRSLVARVRELFRTEGQRSDSKVFGSTYWPFDSEEQLDNALQRRSGD
jgi:hypothetical protein